MDPTRAPSAPSCSTGVAATVTVVTATACHLCDDALRVLRELEGAGIVALRVHAASSVAGQVLIAHHRPALFPLVVVDGRFLSAGRLSRGRLDRALGRARRGGGR